MTSVGLAISFLTFLVDSYLCYQGSQEVEQRMKTHVNDNPTTSTYEHGERDANVEGAAFATPEESMEYDVCAASRRLDGAFGCTTTPQTTFLVCLLYGLFSFFAWLSVDNGVSFLQFYVLPISQLNEKARCFIGDRSQEEEDIASLQKSPGFGSLPSEVQTWIKSTASRSYYGLLIGGGSSKADVGSFNQSVPYLQLTDGTLVFTEGESDIFFSRSSMRQKQTVGVVAYAPSVNSFQEYLPTEPENSRRFYRRSLELIGFPASPPYHGFCVNFMGDGPAFLHDEFLCKNLQTGMMQRFPSIQDHERGWNGWGGGQNEFFTTGDTLWIASQKTFHRDRSKTTKMSLTSVDIAQMKRDFVLDRNITGTESHHGWSRSGSTILPGCVNYHWIRALVSLAALVVIAAYLYRLDVPSCTVPASLALFLSMDSNQWSKGACFALLVMACVCLYVLVGLRRNRRLWKYVSPEMLMWALYTCQITSNMKFWSQIIYFDTFEDEVISSLIPFPVFSFVVALTTTILLNHPVFQVLAVCFGTLSTVTFFLALMGPNLVLVPILGFTIALGCFQAGTLVQFYRVHMIVSARMMYRNLSNLATRRPESRL